MLLKHFESKDSFNIDIDYEKLNWKALPEDDNSSSDEKRAAILAGLNLLEKENVACKIENPKNKYTYIILNSRKNQDIQIEIGIDTARNLVNITNQFLPMMDINYTNQSTIDKIGEAEIIILLKAVSYLATQLQGKINDKEKTKDTPENE